MYSMKSNILDAELEKSLHSVCEFSLATEWNLLYRGSEELFSADAFHLKCDAKPDTLTVIRAASGFIFGGYTTALWKPQSRTYESDDSAFLFSLKNKQNIPMKIRIGKGKQRTALQYSSMYGPIFGGCDIAIADRANVNMCKSNLGHTYVHPTFVPGSDESNSYLAGSSQFTITEIEIYQKIK
jgi:hypothetical protein